MVTIAAARIVAGSAPGSPRAPPGAQLPSTAALVAEYGASPVTVQKALRTSIGAGLVESRPGVGTFVRAVRAAPPAGLRLADGSPRRPAGTAVAALLDPAHRRPRRHRPALRATRHPSCSPSALVRAAIARAARSERRHHPRRPSPGMPELQDVVRARAGGGRPRGRHAARRQRRAGHPGQPERPQSSIFRALVGAGQPLLIESPDVLGRHARRGAGRRHPGAGAAAAPTAPTPTSSTARCERDRRPRVLRAADFANPTGAQWTAEPADAVLDVVRRHGAFLVEDDWAHDFGIDADPRPIAAHDDDGPRRLPALADQERVAGAPGGRRHRPRPGPRAHPRRSRRRVDVRQRAAAGGSPRRRHPARVAHPPAQPAPAAAGAPRPAARQPARARPDAPTSTHVAAGRPQPLGATARRRRTLARARPRLRGARG